MRGSLKAYKSVAVTSQKDVASPYKMVQMLLAGALERLARARSAMEQNQPAQKGELIGAALAIVAELQAALDVEAGGDIAANLDNLYDFAARELMLANSENSAVRLENAAGVLREIKAAWDAIPAEQQEVPA
ncbi:flagellar export chaperone FliS [Oceanimonas pelagia]|uniref:Flagellar secretion chaperone FliS n=1 Tax=Oceanimonas pelagia TaxID=3028314 RepID=A0AA50QAS8_9GAMM|nr:flagellar export chaperone FliS [Oceanimonas pelagia]WMC11363.1 flagellar export chaperone FliS [Oceanimonas pelagia]